MKNLRLFALIALLLPAVQGNAQITVSGVTMPATMEIKGQEMVLNGAGLREKMWIDLYVGGLYLPAKTTDQNVVMNTDQPTAIKLHIVSTMITNKKMIAAVEEGFQKSTGGNTEPFKGEIEKFKACFTEAIAEHDVFDIIYIPGKGTVIYKNSKLRGLIPGLEFKKVLFGIWFCDSPADAALKKGMLGS